MEIIGTYRNVYKNQSRMKYSLQKFCQLENFLGFQVITPDLGVAVLLTQLLWTPLTEITIITCGLHKQSFNDLYELQKIWDSAFCCSVIFIEKSHFTWLYYKN